MILRWSTSAQKNDCVLQVSESLTTFSALPALDKGTLLWKCHADTAHTVISEHKGIHVISNKWNE